MKYFQFDFVGIVNIALFKRRCLQGKVVITEESNTSVKEFEQAEA